MPNPTPAPARYWVRNEQGRVWGPFGLDAIGRLDLGTGDVKTRIHVSADGRTFTPLGENPEVVRALELAIANAPPVRRFVQVKPEATMPPGAQPPLPPAPPTPRAIPVPVEEDPGPPAQGELSATSTIDLYSRAAGHLLTGRLSIEAESGAYAVFFKKGTPERVDVPRTAEDLAKLLVKRNAAPAAEIQKALDLSGGPDGELVDALFALGLVPPQDVFRYLGELGIELLERVLALESGRFRWEPGVAPPAGSFPFGQRWQLLCEWVRKLPPGAVRRRLGDRGARAVYRSSAARAKLEDLKLTAQETRVAALFDGTRSPEIVALDLPGEADVVRRTALLLGDVAFVSFGPELRDAARATVATAADVAPAVEKVSAFEDRGAAGPGDGSALGKVGLKSVAVRKPAEGEPKAPPAGPVVIAPAPIAPPPPATNVITPPYGTASAVIPPPPPAVVVPPAAPAPKAAAPAPAPAAAPKAVAPPAPAKPAAPRAPAPRPEPARAPPPVMTTASHTERLKTADELRALAAKWRDASHFEVLGVGEKASAAEVKTAYFGLAKRYHPDAVPGAEAESKAIRDELISRINEANRVLSDEKERATYLEDLKAGSAEKVDIGPILQAEEDFLRATLLVKARKYADAADLLDQAIQLNPAEGEFLAWRAYARFVASKDKRALYEHALEECLEAVKMNERCAAAHLFIGQMSRIVGELARAEKAFRQVLVLEPSNAEAKSELRALGKGPK